MANPNGLQVARRLVLRGTEKRELGRIKRAHTSEQRLAQRASIILMCGQGLTNSQIADELGVSVKTVRKWRERFVFDRIDGLNDEPRSGRPTRFDSGPRHEVFSLAVSPPPPPYARWTVDLLAEHLVGRGLVKAISRETVSLWLRTADIKPHRFRYWLTSHDPDFKVKRDRVIAIYQNPPCCAEVLCVDEKTSIQALERLHPDLPAGPRWRRRQEFEYVRHGTVHLLAAFNVRTGKVVADVLLGRNTSAAFIRFLKRLLRAHPPDRQIYLIMDNGTTHKSKETQDFLKTQPRLVPIFLPTHASWLNQVEIWFSALSRQALRGASFASREDLRRRLLDYVKLHNRALAQPYAWSTQGKPLSSGRIKTGRAVKALLGRAQRRAVV